MCCILAEIHRFWLHLSAPVSGLLFLLLNQAGTSSPFVVVVAAPGLLLLFLVDQKRTRKTVCVGGAGALTGADGD